MDPRNIDPAFFVTLNGVAAAAYQLLGLETNGEPNGEEPNIESAKKVLDILKAMTEVNHSYEETVLLNDVIRDVEERIENACPRE